MATRIKEGMTGAEVAQIIDEGFDNLADEEDITAEDGKLKLRDRAYDADNFSGKGYNILRKNIQQVTVPKFDLTINTGCTANGNITINEISIEVTTEASTPEAVAQLIQSAISGTTISGAVVTFTSNPTIDYSTTGVSGQVVDNSYQKNRNILTQDMVNEANTVYEIRYDFDLGGIEVTIPENCTLKFVGGKLSNGTVNCSNNATIDSTLNDILDVELINYKGNVFKADWLVGADNVKISKSFEVFGNTSGSILLQDRTYNCSTSIEVAGKDPAISIYADGRATLLFTNKNDAGLHFNRDWVTIGTSPKFSIRNINIQGQEKFWWNVDDEYIYGDTIGLYINSGQRVTLENLNIHGFKIGFKINGGTDVSATNCYFYDCESGAVISSDTQFFNVNYFNNCQFRQNTRNGLLVSQTNFEINTLSLINCKFEANNMYIDTNSATEEEQINYATKYKLSGEYGNGLKLSGIVIDQVVLLQVYFEANIHAICIDSNFMDTLYLYNCRLVGNYLTKPCDIWYTDKNRILSLFANGLNDFYANRPTINKLDGNHKLYQVNSKILAPDPTYVYEFSSATNETRRDRATQRYCNETDTAIIESQCITLYQELNDYGFYDILNNEAIVYYDDLQIGKIKSVDNGSIIVDITANVSNIPLLMNKGSHFSIDGNSSVKFKDMFNYGESVNYGIIFNYKYGSIMQLVPNTLNIVENNITVGSVQRIYIPQSGSCYIYNKTSSPIILPEGSYYQFGTGVNSIPAGGIAHIYSWANITYVLSCHTSCSDKSKYTLPTDLGAGFEFPCSSWITMTNDFPSLGIYNHQQKKWLNSMGLTFARVKGADSERPILTANDAGVQYFDTTLSKPIWWIGTAWVDSEGNDADSTPITSGTFANKPTGVDIGYTYFCTDKQTIEGTTNGIMIYYKGDDTWVDALGRIIQ